MAENGDKPAEKAPNGVAENGKDNGYSVTHVLGYPPSACRRRKLLRQSTRISVWNVMMVCRLMQRKFLSTVCHATDCLHLVQARREMGSQRLLHLSQALERLWTLPKSPLRRPSRP